MEKMLTKSINQISYFICLSKTNKIIKTQNFKRNIKERIAVMSQRRYKCARNLTFILIFIKFVNVSTIFFIFLNTNIKTNQIII